MQIAQTWLALRMPMLQRPRLPQWEPGGHLQRGKQEHPDCCPPPAAGSRTALADRKSLRQLIARERQSPVAFGGDFERHPRDGKDSASRTFSYLINPVLSGPRWARIGGTRTDRTEIDC